MLFCGTRVNGIVVIQDFVIIRIRLQASSIDILNPEDWS